MAPIPPPPPPPAAPKTIALGQTKDQVAAILGQPDKIANLGSKEIDYYSDMKVIFANGKVTDIQ
jgi:outer membrane protein assembly factor BamE (lipoprotein component of BamABCDE complex)